VGLLSNVEEALASGLMVADGEGLAFAHELVRSAVAESVPAGVHRTLRDEAVRRLGQPRAAGPPHTPGPPSAPGLPSPPARLGTRRPNDPPRAADQLSHRERVIARFVGEGMTNRQIAARMYLSPHTVNFHLRQIFRKLHINSRVRLVGLTYAQTPDYPEAS
jgi:DNA-binding CsgD family transcriptional regulator